jgi:hypothetical protein
MPGRHQFPAHVLPGSHQIPGRLGGLIRNGHRDDLPGVQQPGQMPRVPGIGLDPVPGGPQQLRRRSDLDIHSRPAQKTGQAEPGRTRLVGHPHRTRQGLDPPRHIRVRRRQPALPQLPGRTVQGRGDHRPCMHIQTHARTLNNHWGPPASVALRPGQSLTATHADLRSRPPATSPIPSSGPSALTDACGLRPVAGSHRAEQVRRRQRRMPREGEARPRRASPGVSRPTGGPAGHLELRAALWQHTAVPARLKRSAGD